MAGGDIYLGGGGGTSAQRANGFEDRTEDFFAYMMMAGGPDADEERVRLYAEGALAHFDWLKAQGVPYRDTHIPGKTMMPGTGDCLILSGSEYAWPFREYARPCPRGHLPDAVGETGGFILIDALSRRVRELGVEIHYDARAQALVVDEAGRVRGLVVRIAGETKYARAKGGVILCAGGFVLNQAMLEQYAPQFARLADDALSGGYDDGSGIRMGMSVGGAAIHMDELFTTFTIYPPEANVRGILVNEQGRQVGDRIFLLVDDSIFSPPTELSRWQVAAVGESWEEVERELGMIEGTLSATVERHNRFAEKGEDPLFHKAADWLAPLDTPPFAAIACHLGEAFYPYFTLGGLRVKPTGEVLTADGDPIAGLYAAGRTACGLPRWAEGYSSGMSLGDCTFFGRMAGRQAATNSDICGPGGDGRRDDE
jgi:succinate dehydrogenase/fumarate reductase flavoprotein subunit